MKQYTGMFIIRPNLTEDDYKAVIESILKVFTDNESKVIEVKPWGMRDLAYEIDDLRKGYYVLFTVEATVEALAEFDRVANINEKLIRHILVKE